MLPATESLKLCIKWLRSGDLTEAELRKRLLAKNRPDEEIESALEAVKSRKWQSDGRVIERVKETASLRLEGRAKIESRLAKKGLGEEEVQEAVSDLDQDSEKEKALACLRLRLKGGDAPAKAARLLASSGFDEEVIQSVLEEAFPEWQGQEPG